MQAKIRIGSHPVHAMLVVFPIGLYAVTFVSFVVYGIGGDPFWYRAGATANLAGVIAAAVTAVPGFLDWLLAVPGRTQAKRTGIVHLAFNSAALLLFMCSAFGTFGKRLAPPLAVGVAPWLTGAGLALTVIAGWHGWALVQKYHVGVTLDPAQQRIDAEQPEEITVTHPLRGSRAA